MEIIKIKNKKNKLERLLQFLYIYIYIYSLFVTRSGNEVLPLSKRSTPTTLLSNQALDRKVIDIGF